VFARTPLGSNGFVNTLNEPLEKFAIKVLGERVTAVRGLNRVKGNVSRLTRNDNASVGKGMSELAGSDAQQSSSSNEGCIIKS
jgi:hypothetical protein